MVNRNIIRKPIPEQHDGYVKVGIIVVRELEDFADKNIGPFVEQLTKLGCTSQHINVREVAKLHDSIMMIQYFAQYTDVDSVIILVPEECVLHNTALMNVTVGGQERALDMQDMYFSMREMEATAPCFDGEEQEQLDINFS